MRLYIYIIGVVLLMVSCASPKTLLDRGQYDMAIEKSVKKLKKYPAKAKHVYVLKEAYRIANEKDNHRINYLKKEGNPENWDEVYSIYTSMKCRQEVVNILHPALLSRVNYQYVNYDEEIIAAKKKAADYFYNHAKRLLSQNDKMMARQAYDELMRLKELFSNYKDADQLINSAHEKGMNYVVFQMKNATRIPLPPDFEDELTKISLSELNSKWITFDSRKIKNKEYDYAIVVNMKRIDVSPEMIKELERVEKTSIDDGFEYVLDKRGNVIKDSLGNDIKIKRFKQVLCYITEHQMHKRAVISGSIDFVHVKTGQLIKTDPITSEFVFDYKWIDVKGDRRALSESTKSMLKNKPMPFPNDFGLLLSTGQILKEMTKDIILKNKRMFN